MLRKQQKKAKNLAISDTSSCIWATITSGKNEQNISGDFSKDDYLQIGGSRSWR